MKARLRKLAGDVADQFWLLPAVMVVGGVALAAAFVAIDRDGLVPAALIQRNWIYGGGSTGAFTLLGTIAASTIGVAGTVFSITIAALSLAAGQMGPRLLRNFTRDRGNQFTLGAFLGTFSYTLVVLRTVRSQEEQAFVPSLSLTLAIGLALLCVGTLVFFVGHMAGRINVDTVIDLVADDVRASMRRLTLPDAPPPRPPQPDWSRAVPVADPRRGYLQELDADALADWADRNRTPLRLLVRPGDFVFPGAPVALAAGAASAAAGAGDGAKAGEEAGEAIRQATALSPARTSTIDLEFAVRQLVEVAVRALSPGINDPYTAIAVLDRLGAALCDTAGRHLPDGVEVRQGAVVLTVPSVDYDGLCDSMFHMVRQNATTDPAVLIRILDVLTAVAACEPAAPRRATLTRHAALVLHDAERHIATPGDIEDVRRRHAGFTTMRDAGPVALLTQHR